jgi:selenocysteine-specific elongation factor
MEEEVRDRLRGTTLEGAPVVAVSARTGEGLDALRAEMDRLLSETEPRADKGKPRLPVDRAFTVAGFGTVVTGTLVDGMFRVGQEVVTVPGRARSRIRGLQSHKHKVESIGPGNRVAVNLTALDVEQLPRGTVLTTPGWLQPTRRVDVHLTLLPDAPGPIEQNDPLDFFAGAAETPAHITLLDADRLEPGAAGWAQLRLQDELAVARGDRYIVRQASPSVTVGGGVVVDPHPRRHKRFNEDTLNTLETLQRGTPEELILEVLGATPQEVRAVVEASGLNTEATEALTNLLTERQALQLTGNTNAPISNQGSVLIMSTKGWEALLERVRTLLGHFHRQHPLKRGMGKEELKSRLGTTLPPRAFSPAMAYAVARGLIAEDATTYRLPSHEPTYTAAQREQVEQLRQAHRESPYSPPSPAELGVEPEVVTSLVDAGELVKIDDTLFYTRPAYEEMRRLILETIDRKGEINVASMRDLFGTTRKYAIPFLEHLDAEKVTKRVGDVRVRW